MTRFAETFYWPSESLRARLMTTVGESAISSHDHDSWMMALRLTAILVHIDNDR
jgi:hypothetical protein